MTVGMTRGSRSARTRTVRAHPDTALVPYVLDYGSFPVGSRVFVVPVPSLEVDETIPLAGRVIAEGVADEFGRVALPLYKAGEGPVEQAFGLLRCVVAAGPLGPRIVIYPRRTLAIVTGSFPTVPWDLGATTAVGALDDFEARAATPEPPWLQPTAWEPRVTYQPHTMILPPEHPQAEGRRIIAPDRTPTWQSSVAVLREGGRPKGTPPPPAYHGYPEPTP